MDCTHTSAVPLSLDIGAGPGVLHHRIKIDQAGIPPTDYLTTIRPFRTTYSFPFQDRYNERRASPERRFRGALRRLRPDASKVLAPHISSTPSANSAAWKPPSPVKLKTYHPTRNQSNDAT